MAGRRGAQHGGRRRGRRLGRMGRADHDAARRGTHYALGEPQQQAIELQQPLRRPPGDAEQNHDAERLGHVPIRILCTRALRRGGPTPIEKGIAVNMMPRDFLRRRRAVRARLRLFTNGNEMSCRSADERVEIGANIYCKHTVYMLSYAAMSIIIYLFLSKETQ